MVLRPPQRRTRLGFRIVWREARSMLSALERTLLTASWQRLEAETRPLL